MFSSGIIPVIKENGKIYVLLGEDDSGWSAFAGSQDLDETPQDTAFREFHEETGLVISVGEPCLVNEFHDPNGSFHQVDVYFSVSLISGDPAASWTDPEGVVTERRLVTREELAGLRVKPDSLADIAWDGGIFYDPLEPILR